MFVQSSSRFFKGLETVESLKITLTQGAIDNGYIRIPSGQKMFPSECMTNDESNPPPRTFYLIADDGEKYDTYVLKRKGRLKKRFGAYFKRRDIRAGTIVEINRVSDFQYTMSFQTMSQSLTDMFRQYKAAPYKNWLASYRNRCEEFRTYRGAAPESINTEILSVVWQEKSNGVANVGQGLMSKKEFTALLPELPGITQSIINDPSPEKLDEILRWAQAQRASGIITRVLRTVVHRVFAGVNPEMYSTIANESDVDALIDSLNQRFGLGISKEGNWATKNAALMESIKNEGLRTEDLYLLNTFAWWLFDTLIRQGKLENQHDENSTEASQSGCRNLVFYGPPGTGKTYELRGLIDSYVGEAQSIGKEAWLTQQLSEARWFDTVFAALFDMRGKSKVSDIESHEFVKSKVKALGRSRNVTQTIWATLQAHAVQESITVKTKDRTAPLVFDKSTDSVWSLVDNWEEECADLAEQAKAWRLGPTEDVVQRRYEFVTFHQSYGYEDFVEGIRPIQDDEARELTYPVVPGVFRRICQRAKADPSQRYAIFIDEINRGNIAKIFGELITLIEADKRAVYGTDGYLVSGMEVTLPYSGDSFGVPLNLDIYGTMNTADRSLALLDTALRRRFEFSEMMPDPTKLNKVVIQGTEVDLPELLRIMNQRITVLYDREHTLGHAFFMPLNEDATLPHLSGVFRHKILPLLQEYFFEDWDKIRLVLGDSQKQDETLQFILKETLRNQKLFGANEGGVSDAVVYSINDAAFDQIGAYIGINNG